MRSRGACSRREFAAIFAVGLAGACTVTLPANAADPPMSTNAMTNEGLRAFEAGRYVEADEKLSRALDLVGVPTLALYAARTNVRLSHWVKASELYLLAMRLNAKSTADINLLQAQHEAEKERSELLAHIPRLTIALDGEDLDTVEVTLDSDPVPKALLGANQLVDPGHHIVCATRDGQLVTGEIDVLESQHKTTTLHFARRESKDSQSQILPSIATSTESANATDPSATPHQPNQQPVVSGVRRMSERGDERQFDSADPAPAQRDSAQRGPDSVDPLRTMGWIGVGLGGVGLLVGVTSGLMAVSARSSLANEASCVGNNCTSARAAEVDRYNQLRHWSTTGFVVGGLVGAAGATLILVESGKQREPRAGLVVGPGTASFAARF